MNEESATSTETNKGVEVRRSSESHSEFVISDQGSETVAQEHETVVTVVVTEVAFYRLACTNFMLYRHHHRQKHPLRPLLHPNPLLPLC